LTPILRARGEPALATIAGLGGLVCSILPVNILEDPLPRTLVNKGRRLP